MKDEKRYLRVMKGILFFSFFILHLSFYGCRPRGILHSWEMRDLLVDLHKTDAMIQVSGMSRGNDEAKGYFYAQVLEKHGVTQAEFDSSLVWYTAHPQLFDKIYPKVLAQLKAEEEEFLAQHDAELNLLPEDKKTAPETELPVFTPAMLDSTLWVTRNGYPSSWHVRAVPFYLMKNSEE